MLRSARTVDMYAPKPRPEGLWGRLAREFRFQRRERSVDRDAVAIKRVLSRLSDRRLRLIGLRRHTLDQDVRRMIWDTENSRTIDAEVLQILEDADNNDRAIGNQTLLPARGASQMGPHALS